MAEPLLLPLRPPGGAGSEPWGSLQTRVRQIENLKGSFRNITEKSLRDEIDKSASGEIDAASGNETSDEEVESNKTREVKVWKAREEMMRQLARAQNETLTAIDFVSLLLSKHEQPDNWSLSPALQAAVSGGTLDGRKVAGGQTLAREEQRLASVSTGWKTDSFREAAEKISEGGTRLELQSKHEAAFWEQVAELKTEGWTISRLPQDNRAIGVHFGFAEAAPRFRNRGFAILRTGTDGKIHLDQNAALAKNAAVQICILRKGHITGRSTVTAPLSATKTTLSGEIAEARRNLFEEELFYEIGREARTITNQGVSMIGRAITVDVMDGQEIRIELVGGEEEKNQDRLPEDDIAEGTVLCLRALLSEAHRRNLARRSKAPPPMLPKPASSPEYALLRPLISHLRHRYSVSKLALYFSRMVLTMRTAGLKFEANTMDGMDLEASSSSASHESILAVLLHPAKSKIRVILPTSRSLELTIRTHLGPPAYGSEYSISPLAYGLGLVKAPRLADVMGVKTFICHVLMLDLVALIESLSMPLTTQDFTGKTEPGTPKVWKATDRYSGELELRGLKQQSALLYVKIWHDRIGLRYIRRASDISAPVKDLSWVWQDGGFSYSAAASHPQHEQQHLPDILRTLRETDESSSSVQ